MAESLYIHIPFCVSKCLYCDFLSVPIEEGPARAYAHALKKELALRGGGRLRTVYIGGGTPTALPEELLGEIFAALRGSFTLLPGAEVTVEANPGTVDARKAARLRSMGVNRVSLGVQSFDDRELRTLGRAHTSAEAARAVKALGAENLSLDLIYGIPGQDARSWEETLRRAVELGPKHISAYELTPEPGTPIMDSLKKGVLTLPQEDEALEMSSLALDTLARSGYRRYEVSNYALPGFECRHNLNYWRRGEYIGAGAGAYSFSGDRRDRNTPDIGEYMELLSRGRPPAGKSARITPEEAMREFLFLGLRLTEGVDMAWFRDELGLDLAGAVGELLGDGLVETEGGRLRLTRRGFLLFNPVVVRLMENLGL